MVSRQNLKRSKNVPLKKWSQGLSKKAAFSFKQNAQASHFCQNMLSVFCTGLPFLAFLAVPPCSTDILHSQSWPKLATVAVSLPLFVVFRKSFGSFGHFRLPYPILAFRFLFSHSLVPFWAFYSFLSLFCAGKYFEIH